MGIDRPNCFAGAYLERRAEEREEANWLEVARADPATLFVVASGTRHLICAGPEPRIAFLTGDHPAVRGAASGCLVLLGWFRGVRCVLLEVAVESAETLLPGARFEELRPLSPLLAGEDAALLAYARALSVWRRRQRHCGVCGAPTMATRAGHCLRCTNPSCGEEFFPRLDPAIIVLVSDGTRALLGRQPSWPPRRYSTIAGFVEPGESLEDAVVREVAEETGVRVIAARYDSSQPWPFPSSLMVGFSASAAPGSEIRVSGELEDARWLTREEIAGGAVLLPPPHSISHRLISSWLSAE